MRDLSLIAFIFAMMALGLKRPFMFVLLYAYVDIIAPQKIAYFLISGLPLSMMVSALAIGGWLVADAKRGFTFTFRQGLMVALLLYAAMTTINADMGFEIARGKWEWVWKAVVFAAFLPMALRTKLRIEAYMLVMLASLAALMVLGGIKTIFSGGGYGTLVLLIDDNSGLYEGSTISTIAIAVIPLILWFTKYGTVYKPDWKVQLFCYALIFACLLIPIGTSTRTGLLCIGLLFLLQLRDSKRRFLYIGGAAALAAIAVPLLPQSYTQRMNTIQGYQADQSAGTRLAVWGWTLDYVREHPFGGGFEAYLQNRISVQITNQQGSGGNTSVASSSVQDAGRAWHSAYFEMLGEQGFPGLGLWLLLHLTGIIQMERLRRRYRHAEPDNAWIRQLATSLQHFQLIYMLGAAFVGIAFQPFVWMMLGVQIAFDRWVSRTEAAALKAGRSLGARRAQQQPAGRAATA